jgi:hypothetical protein
MLKLRISLILLISGLVGFLPLYGQDVVINEMMSDNDNSVFDEDGESADWIELYNRGSSTVDLEGYHLSDDENDLQKWTFPQVELQSGNFLLVFASGKDIIGIGSLHTNFKISAEGEKLFLSNKEEVILDEVEAIELKEDESFGRLPDGSNNQLILPSSSPSESNNNSNKLLFSHEAGLYDTPFELSISSYLEDSIYYTIDGSEPTSQSLLYESNLLLKNISSNPNFWSEIPTSPIGENITYPTWTSPNSAVDKANIIRCATFKNEIKTSDTYTKSYLILDDILNRYDMPVISLITEGDNFFDNDVGIYVPGVKYDSTNPEWTGNYFTDEIESERPIHIEYFEPNGELGFSQNAGVRIHGGKTRHAAQKSLKLYARKAYGDKDFDYPLMPQNGVNKYERFLLQTTMGAWGGETVVKDILAHEIVKDLNIERMDYQPAVVFLNGEYWGIHHIRDRIDEEYLAYTTGLAIDSIVIDRTGNNHFFALIDYFKSHLPINNEALDYISTQMDIDGFIDYQIAEMFLNNYDWPSNNTRHWRPKTEDGKWRWIFFDLDGGFGDYNYNMLEHNTNADSSITWPNGAGFTFFFRSLIENDKFLEQFLSRYKVLLENDFRISVTKEKLFGIIEEYQAEMPHHIDRWSFPMSMNTWLDDIDKNIIDFLKKRPCAVVENIIDFFGLPSYDVVCKDSLDNVIQTPANYGFSISPNPNNGKFSIHNNSPNTRLFQINILNTLGQIIYQKSSTLLKRNTNEGIDISHSAPGIYYLKIKEMNAVFTIPFVITN